MDILGYFRINWGYNSRWLADLFLAAADFGMAKGVKVQGSAF